MVGAPGLFCVLEMDFPWLMQSLLQRKTLSDLFVCLFYLRKPEESSELCHLQTHPVQQDIKSQNPLGCKRPLRQ